VEPLAERDSLLAEIAALADGLGLDRAEIAAEWSTNHAGQPLRDASDVGGLELLRDDLASKVGASA
jgi:hypothetical protein